MVPPTCPFDVEDADVLLLLFEDVVVLLTVEDVQGEEDEDEEEEEEEDEVGPVALPPPEFPLFMEDPIKQIEVSSLRGLLKNSERLLV